MNNNKQKKICLISSSGGHYEQLKMLSYLSEKHNTFWVTENTEYTSDADYYLKQTGTKDYLFPLKMIFNIIRTLKIWMSEKPDLIITTGTLIAIPMTLIAKILGKKIIYIETFARVHDGTKAGKFVYKYADLFIIQWETLEVIFPEAVFGGSIY